MTGIAGAVTRSFGYDGVGRRGTKTIARVKTDYLYDGLNFVQEKNGATVNANLLTGLGIDEVYRRTQGATSSDILRDALGSTVALADTTRALTTQYTYAPYGETAQAGASNNNTQKFTGREDDGTGLMYYRARYYSPTYGRFTAEDPLGLVGGANLYVYGSGNPQSFVDPYGLETTVVTVHGGVNAVPHSAVHVATPGTPNFLYDPAGSYVGASGEPRGSGDFFYGKDASLKDYIRWHEARGATVVTSRIPTTPSQERGIKERAEARGGAYAFFCAEAASSAVAGVCGMKRTYVPWALEWQAKRAAQSCEQ